MTQKELTDKAKQILAQAEQKLAEKQRKELLDAIKSIKIEQPHITINPPQIHIPKIEIPPIKLPEFPPQEKQEIIVKQEPSKDIDTTGIEKTLKDVLSKFKFPKPEVSVQVPKFDKMEWPEGNMPIDGLVSLKGIDKEHPLPVELRNSDGSPMKWPEFVGGGGGGRSIARIGGIDASAWGEILTPDGRLKVSDLSSSGTQEVIQVSGAVDSVNVMQINGQTPALNVGDVDTGTLRIISAKSVNASTIAVSIGADASTNVTLTNLNRKSLAITHNSSSNLYVSTGTAASTTSFPILANQIIIFDDYTGPVNAIAQEQAGTISVRYIEID